MGFRGFIIAVALTARKYLRKYKNWMESFDIVYFVHLVFVCESRQIDSDAYIVNAGEKINSVDTVLTSTIQPDVFIDKFILVEENSTVILKCKAKHVDFPVRWTANVLS